jgi:hypothetical protein
MKYTNRILILALFMSGLATNSVYTAPYLKNFFNIGIRQAANNLPKESPITFSVQKSQRPFGEKIANFILTNTENPLLAEIAIKLGACPNVRLDREGNTLFHRAVANPANPVFFNIAQKTGCDPNLPNYRGITPGIMALRGLQIDANLRRDPAFVKLVQSGASSESFTRNDPKNSETIRFMVKFLNQA